MSIVADISSDVIYVTGIIQERRASNLHRQPLKSIVVTHGPKYRSLTF